MVLLQFTAVLSFRNMKAVELAPLWRRFIAYFLDLFILQIVLSLCLQAIYGAQLTQWMNEALVALENQQVIEPFSPYLAHLLIALSAIYVCTFWHLRCATPGQMLLKIQVVDGSSFSRLSPPKIVTRFFVLYGVTFALGFLVPPQIGPISIVFLTLGLRHHKRQQGIHDLAAGSIVIMAHKLDINPNDPNIKDDLSKKSQREF